MSGPLVAVEDLAVTYAVPGEGRFARPRRLEAVRGVSFELAEGETLGIVGESGCGKTSLARALVGLVPEATGTVRYFTETGSRARRARRRRREVQLVFQDPLASLNPRMTAAQCVAEPLRVHFPDMLRSDRDARVAKALERVGLDPAQAGRFPHEFSGGQCQRIGIARALVLEPRVVICDEPVSALDLSVRAQIINLLMSLRAEFGLSLVFIAHDLGVVRHLCDRVMVMYLGRIVETGPAAAVLRRPAHPYTQALLAAEPVPDPTRQPARLPAARVSEVPSPLSAATGCAFSARCAHAADRCAENVPVLREFQRVEAACHRLEAIHESGES